jgi:hypothetical protein
MSMAANQRPVASAMALAAATAPVLSFALQYLFSVKAGTEHTMLHHLTVTWVDWTLVPFNFFAIQCIDWTRGKGLFGSFVVAMILNAIAHQDWATHGLDAGHMFDPSGMMRGAGWVHFVFATCEAALLISFVFQPDSGARPGSVRGAKAAALLYFVTMFAAGIAMHDGVIATDAIAFGSGVFFIAIYPVVATRLRARNRL